MRQGNITFGGKSGEKYLFQVWPFETRFKPVAAVYFVTKRAYDNSTYRRASHDGIYIGHTADLSAVLASESLRDRFKRFGANCICVHVLADEARRISIEQDLLAMHSTHCNHHDRAASLFSAMGSDNLPAAELKDDQGARRTSAAAEPAPE